jgi:hypothetical protein
MSVGRLADVLEEHTVAATWNLSVLRTGERVHECNGGCAADIEQRLRAKGVLLAASRAIGEERARAWASRPRASNGAPQHVPLRR